MRYVPFSLLLLFAAPANAQDSGAGQSPQWQPDVQYIAAGQDEPGYRSWYLAAPWHAAGVKALNDYLTASGVGGIVPTWQLLRTATEWQKCGAEPFEIAPTEDWANIVQTLRYVRDDIIPAIGPVEPVSVYRNPVLNQCAGGAAESAHRYMAAMDLVPLRPTSREALIGALCTVHAADGERYGIGLGFYAFLRFHVDSQKFRKWGVDDIPEAKPCLSEPTPQPLVTVAAQHSSPTETGAGQIPVPAGTAKQGEPLQKPVAEPLATAPEVSAPPKP